MATARDIPAELTIEIDDAPSPARFLAAARAWFGYIADLSRDAASTGEVPEWTVQVKEGSNMIALRPKPTVPTEGHRYVWNRAAKTVPALIRDGLDGVDVSEEALRHLTALSELASGPRERPMAIRLWIQKSPIVVDATIASRVREEERLGYRDFGTVEGIMDTVQDRQGHLQFRVRDPALGDTVMCQISEDQLTEAFRTFRHRVEVSGVIHYRRDGTPISIAAERIEQIPGDDELPGPDDVRGILIA